MTTRCAGTCTASERRAPPQCIVLDDKKTGTRKVAGTHWDFNSYGGELKKAMGIAPQARPVPALARMCTA